MYASQQQLLRRAKSISNSVPSSPNSKVSPINTSSANIASASDSTTGTGDNDEGSVNINDNLDVFLTPSSSNNNTIPLNEYVILDTPNAPNDTINVPLASSSSLLTSANSNTSSTNALPESVANCSTVYPSTSAPLHKASSSQELNIKELNVQQATVSTMSNDLLTLPVGSSSTTSSLASPSHSSSQDRGTKRTSRSSSSSWVPTFLNPTYKSRSEEFCKLFADLVPASERLVVDYSCALQKEILVHGRVYVTLNYICFYANIFKWQTKIVIRCSDVTSLSKANTAKVIPNAIQLTTKDSTKYILTSFAARDKTYIMMFRVWQNALLEQPLSSDQFWSWIQNCYGQDLGYTSEEEEEARGSFESNMAMMKKAGMSDSTSSEEGATSRSTSDVTAAIGTGDQGNLSRHQAMDEVTGDFTGNNELKLNAEINCHSSQQQPKPLEQLKSVTCVAPDPSLIVDDEEEESLPNLEPVNCGCKEHRGKLLADQVFIIPVDAAFTLIFSESKFFKNSMSDRNISNLAFSPWTEEDVTDPEIMKKRTVKYTVALNHTLVKSAPTTETQSLLQARPGEVYKVLVSAVNEDIPYSDTFSVESVYCLTRGRNDNETRIVVHAEVVFTGSGWRFKVMRPLIEKNADEGIAEHVNHIMNCLNKYCNECPSIINEIVEVASERRPSTKKSDSLNSRTSHRLRLEDSLERNICWNSPEVTATAATVLARSSSRSSSIRDIITSPSNHGTLNGAASLIGDSSDTFVLKVIIAVLIVLFASNVFLYIQLWRLENAAEEYEVLLKSASSHSFNLPSPSSISKLRLVLSKAIEVVQIIENHLGGLNSDLDNILHSSS